MSIKFTARKAGDPRGAYGHDILFHEETVGHVYEQSGEIAGVKWRAEVTIDGHRGYACRSTRARAAADAIANATRHAEDAAEEARNTTWAVEADTWSMDADRLVLVRTITTGTTVERSEIAVRTQDLPALAAAITTYLAAQEG